MAVLAGIDMSMVPYDFTFTDDLLALVKDGEVPMARIDEAVRRILRVKFELGLFQNAEADPAMQANIGAPAFQAVSRPCRRRSDHAAQERPRAPSSLENGARLRHRPRRALADVAVRRLVVQLAGHRHDAVSEGRAHVARRAPRPRRATGSRTCRERRWTAPSIFRRRWPPRATPTSRSSRSAKARTPRIPGNIDDLTLPEAQLRLARAIEATGTPVVLVLLHGRPRIIHDAVPGARAVVTGYETGPFGGDALAEVIYGELNPSGRLPFSWPRSSGAILIPYDRARPADINGTDSSQAGYNPEWPFGHGLSYTTFRYDSLRLANANLGAADTLVVSVRVTNTGQREGRESVLLYVRDLVASVTPPMRRLRASMV